MSPLQPRDDRAADRHNGGAAQPQDDANAAIGGRSVGHVEALSHVTNCRTCLKTLYGVFVQSLEQAAALEELRD
jgi:hypothetical protein